MQFEAHARIEAQKASQTAQKPSGGASEQPEGVTYPLRIRRVDALKTPLYTAP